MGVTGLWPILHPCARPIKLETLNRKRLAVDASIWIYQFLKAVRDKEGNALRNSHVVGFFRRICKLLFFGIKPVFVFDGGAPALKRQTVLGRKRRREGRRDDAIRTAGKLLAVQMQRRLEEDEEKRKREREVRGREMAPEEEEELPADADLVYVDEFGMSNRERQQARKFTRKDAYHLPDLDGGIENMGRPDDPRIMSVEELEEYARQFNSGEDINLYDFSKIDFNGEFFMSLPAVDRYNILNAARLRSRLRMGLSKEQLEEMFPDRMAFSKFQIERVRERNELTQRLMNLNGMNDENAMWGATGRGRIAGERDREYVLVKNDGVEGGWALGVVTTDKSLGERNKPIDVDALHRKVKRDMDVDMEEEDDFEDVPIEGLNRLPKLKNLTRLGEYDDPRTKEIAEKRKQFYAMRQDKAIAEEVDSLFVNSSQKDNAKASQLEMNNALDLFVSDGEEDEELNRAIAMSLQNQYEQSESEEDPAEFEDVPMPTYEQKAVEEPKPLTAKSGRMVAHIVNNRANAAVPKRKATSINSDDEENDLSAIFAKRQKEVPKRTQIAPTPSNIRNPWDGPLPFEKLDIRASLLGQSKSRALAETNEFEVEDEGELAGGFHRDDDQAAPKPLPPWMIQENDIRNDVQEQMARDLELNAEDRERALEEERLFRRDHGIIEVESSDESDVELVVTRPAERKEIDLTGESLPASQSGPLARVINSAGELADVIKKTPPQPDMQQDQHPSLTQKQNLHVVERERESSPEELIEWSDSDHGDGAAGPAPVREVSEKTGSPFQGISIAKSASTLLDKSRIDSTGTADHISEDVGEVFQSRSPSPVFEDVAIPDAVSLPITQPNEIPMPVKDPFDVPEEDIVYDIDFDEFSDPEDEELLAQLAIEAEEHARFASTLNNKPAHENQEAYERELKALRNQQKKDRRDADEVSHIMITECQALLRLFGLPYITAPMEAEAQCAELVSLGLVDGIVTDDSDIFLFGGTRVYKNMFNSNKFVECYLANDVEKELSLSRHQLISIAHLLGSDYTEGLAGVGPVTAVEILSEFPSPSTGLQEFKDWWADVQLNSRPKDADSGSGFRRKFRRAQASKLFLPPGFPSPAVTDAYLQPEVDHSPEPFQWGVPDLDALRQFLMATIGWTQERTDEVLVPVIRDMNRREAEGTQSNITRYFEGSIGVGARREGFAPRLRENESVRMKEAVKKLKTKAAATTGLTGTFADEAVEWAEKDKKRAEKERKKSAGKNKNNSRNNGRKTKKSLAPDIDENDNVGDDADDSSS